MLSFLRKRSGGVFSILIIGAIALVFVFWGIGGQDAGSPEDIRIDGRPVSQQAYAEMQQNIIERLREQSAGPLTAEQELAARREALGYLVERQILIDLAERTGRSASPEQINRAVKGNPLFQVDGRFDLETYRESVPRLFGRPLSVFEAALAEDMVVSQTVGLIEDLSWPPTAAVLEDWRFAEESLSLDWAFFPAEPHLAGLDPDPGTLAAWFEERREQWRVPAQVKIDYVEVEIADFFEAVEVTEADLDDAYLEAAETLSVEESAEVRHILFRFPTLTPTDAERREATAKAMAALERARSGDFATLAAELSQDAATASTGGGMTVRRGQTLAPFEEAVFGPGKDNIGQVQGPVETFFGMHLIVVDRYDPGHTKTRDEAAEELGDIVRRRKARRLAVDRVEDLLEALPTTASPTNIADTARSLGLEVKTSEFFHDADAAPAFLAGSPDLIAAALSVPAGQTGDVVDTPDHLVVYSVVDTIDSVLPALEDVREEAAGAWRDERALEMARAAADGFLAQTGEAGGWAAAAEKLPDPVEKGRTPMFARLRFYEAGAHLTEADPDRFLAAYFTLGDPGDQIASPLPVEGASPGWLALRLAETAPPDESALSASALSDRRKTARANLGTVGYEYWSTTGRATARIELPAVIKALISEETL